MKERSLVVSDSTFYISFLKNDEIDNPLMLIKILKSYVFVMGKVVFQEISKKQSKLIEGLCLRDLVELKDLVELEKEYDFRVLLSMIGNRVFKEGEYESIALAYVIHKAEALHSLILDDKKARKWIKRNLPELERFLKYSLRFIANACKEDKKLTKEETIKILNKVKEAVIKGGRPFNLTKDDIKMIDDLIKEVELDDKN